MVSGKADSAAVRRFAVEASDDGAAQTEPRSVFPFKASRDWSHLALRKPASSRPVAGRYGGHCTRFAPATLDSYSGSLGTSPRPFNIKRPRGTLSRAGAPSAHLTGQVHQVGNAVSSAPVAGIRSRGERSSAFSYRPALLAPTRAISSLHEVSLSGGFCGVLVGVLNTVDRLAVVLG
jgi:hypothetical protein